MQPIYVTKNIAAASSTGVGSFSSGGTITLSCATLDTGRRIILWGSTSVAGNITIYGLSEAGTPISETLVGSTIGSVVTSVQDYIKINALSLPSAGFASTTGYLGTSSQGGTPWQAVDTNRSPVNVGFTLTPTTSAIVASFEYTTEAPIYLSPQARWQNPNSVTGPQPTVSSLGSSVTAAAYGAITTPIAAWRVTLTSTSTGAGTINAAVVQSG